MNTHCIIFYCHKSDIQDNSVSPQSDHLKQIVDTIYTLHWFVVTSPVYIGRSCFVECAIHCRYESVTGYNYYQTRYIYVNYREAFHKGLFWDLLYIQQTPNPQGSVLGLVVYIQQTNYRC